jgi:hypothetical protein
MKGVLDAELDEAMEALNDAEISVSPSHLKDDELYAEQVAKFDEQLANIREFCDTEECQDVVTTAKTDIVLLCSDLNYLPDVEKLREGLQTILPHVSEELAQELWGEICRALRSQRKDLFTKTMEYLCESCPEIDMESGIIG